MVLGLWRRVTRVLLLAVVALAGVSAQAAENSLQLVPADAGFYSVMLRNKEQIDLLVGSKAFQAVVNLPQIQDGWKKFQDEYSKEKGESAQFRQIVESPLGKDVIAVLSEAAADEIFLTGSDTVGDTVKLINAVNTSMQYGPMMALLTGMGGGLNPEEIQGYYALKGLASNLPLLKVPDLVIGFKLKNTERAEKLITMLEEAATEHLKKAPPKFRGSLKRTQVGKSNLLTVNIDGSMIPWDEVPIADLEQKEGEFNDLIAKLKQMTFTVSLGIHEGFLVLGVGPSTEPIAKLSGTGALLKDSKEFKVLSKAGTNKLTDINYTSKGFLTKATSGNMEQFDTLLDLAKSGLAMTPLPEAKRAQIEKDVTALVKDIKSVQPSYGATLSFNFLTARGAEGYTYDWSVYPGAAKERPLTLLNHLGSNPILAGVLSTNADVEAYKWMAKYFRLTYGYFVEFAGENIPDEEGKKRFTQVTQALENLGKKFDRITVEEFYPATANGQVGIVLDAQWTSKEWLQGVKFEKAMPMIELGLLMGLSDGDAFTKSITSYRKLINETISEFGRLVPEANVPPALELPPPQKKAAGANALYFYPLPPLPVDERVQPTFGVGKDVAVISCSQGHTERLLAGKPLKLDGGPLASRLGKPLLAASYVDFPALVDAISPWAEMGITLAMKEAMADKKTMEDGMKAYQTVLRLVKCIKVSTTASYREDGATVTHSETVVKDIE